MLGAGSHQLDYAFNVLFVSFLPSTTLDPKSNFFQDYFSGCRISFYLKFWDIHDFMHLIFLYTFQGAFTWNGQELRARLTFRLIYALASSASNYSLHQVNIRLGKLCQQLFSPSPLRVLATSTHWMKYSFSNVYRLLLIMINFNFANSALFPCIARWTF